MSDAPAVQEAQSLRLPIVSRLGCERRPLLIAVCADVVAWAVLNVVIVSGAEREVLRIDGPGGKPCLGTMWTPRAPKAVILLGHGVTANQGVTATAANAFACGMTLAWITAFWLPLVWA